MPCGTSIAVCFTIFEVEMFTTAGRTRFTTASNPARKPPLSESAVWRVGAGFSKGNLPAVAAPNP